MTADDQKLWRKTALQDGITIGANSDAVLQGSFPPLILVVGSHPFPLFCRCGLRGCLLRICSLLQQSPRQALERLAGVDPIFKPIYSGGS